VNFVLRKLAAAASSTMTISVENDQVRILTKGPKDSDHKFHLDTEVESNDPQDNPMKVHSYSELANIHYWSDSCTYGRFYQGRKGSGIEDEN
jgi:hypothetical protein